MSYSEQNTSHTRIIQWQGGLKFTWGLPPELLQVTAWTADSCCIFKHLSIPPAHSPILHLTRSFTSLQSLIAAAAL